MYIPINFLGTKFSGDFTTIDYLVVAGGGSGGSSGGGGGAGGLTSGSFNTNTIPNGIITSSVIVGAGGAAPGFGPSTNGENSSITFITSSIECIGGGGAGKDTSGSYNGKNGGSGGGATPPPFSGTGCIGSPGLGISGQGNDGGTGYVTSGGSTGSGGGGGASEPGLCGDNSQIAGNGGSGSQWLDGNWYAGGGGAIATTFGLSTGIGGIGGGGNASYTGGPAVTSGVNGTGGGGGASTGNAAGAGGSGVVIFRYYGTDLRGVGGYITTYNDYTYHTFTDVGTSSFEFSAYEQNPIGPLSGCNSIKFQAGPFGASIQYTLCNETSSVSQSLSGSEYVVRCVDLSYPYSIDGIGSEIIYNGKCP